MLVAGSGTGSGEVEAGQGGSSGVCGVHVVYLSRPLLNKFSCPFHSYPRLSDELGEERLVVGTVGGDRDEASLGLVEDLLDDLLADLEDPEAGSLDELGLLAVEFQRIN